GRGVTVGLGMAVVTAARWGWRARVFVFFFQAEDGIRDWSVTGVQTCALPIYPQRRRASADARLDAGSHGAPLARFLVDLRGPAQIGRASCRERVEISVVAVSLKKEELERAWRQGRRGELWSGREVERAGRGRE